MYGLIGKMKVVPGQRDQLIAILLDGTSDMPGCLSYVIAADPKDPDAVWITEVWESAEHHKASLALPTVQAAIARGRPLIAGFGERFETHPIGVHGAAGLGALTNAPSSDDEQAVRTLVATWLAATKRGDTQAVLDLMTDDALFLGPGRPPMDKAGFAAASQPPPGPRPVVDGVSDIKEIHVEGNIAYLWSQLAVTVTPPDGKAPVRRDRHTLTIVRKVHGRWLLARDANLLVKV
jgi:uncharacterized protein (TIGR02246 family)